MKNRLLVFLCFSISLSLVAGQPAEQSQIIHKQETAPSSFKMAVVAVQAQLPENSDDAVVGDVGQSVQDMQKKQEKKEQEELIARHIW